MSVVPLPADVTLGQSFERGLDINLGTTGAPSWQPIRRISAWAPTYPATTQEAGTYDDLGADNSEITGRSFATSFTVQGNRYLTTGLYLPELEKILAAAKATGAAAVAEVRWYHKPAEGTPHPTDAAQGFVTVEATRQNTGNAEIDVYNVSLTGKGKFIPIANPFPGWDATVPVLSTATPDEASAGDLVTISGTGLLGATSVKFGAVAVTDFVVANGATIIAAVPAGAAGIAAITVTTPGGESNSLPYTRG